MKALKLIFVIFALLQFSAAPSFSAELLAFAGAGMRQPLTELGQLYTRETGNQVDFDFAGSGRLGGKILMGIEPDLFVPGSTKWASKLSSKGYIEACVPVAYHTPVIITPKGNTKVQSLNDLTRKDIKVVIGDQKAAAIGRNTTRLFSRAGLSAKDMNIVALGVSVKQLVQWVETESVDAAIVWRADAVQSGRVNIITSPDSINLIESIPLCLLKKPAHPSEAKKFWNFLVQRSPAVFMAHGFQPVNP